MSALPALSATLLCRRSKILHRPILPQRRRRQRGRPYNYRPVQYLQPSCTNRVPALALCPGHAFWLDLLDRKVITPVQALAEFSESPENYAAVIGTIENGFFFSV